jgi:hypothetical protein
VEWRSDLASPWQTATGARQRAAGAFYLDIDGTATPAAFFRLRRTW